MSPRPFRSLSLLAVVALALPAIVAAAGCGGNGDAGAGTAVQQREVEPAACPDEWKGGWEKLADRVGAAVYCPSWLPTPLLGELDGEWHSTKSVKRNGYLMGFIWFERGIGEVHVNLRGFPGSTAIPKCAGRPCFSDPGDPKRVAGVEVTPYSVNRGADTWHLLYAWEHEGSLYTVSQHVVPELSLSYSKVQSNLDRIMAGLELVEPTRA
jgi:hypothetical protein